MVAARDGGAGADPLLLAHLAEALEWYGRFLDAWSGADPDLPPVVEARTAVERLGARHAGTEREPPGQ